MSCTTEVKFTVWGDPVPQGRPRFTRTGHAYDPAKSREYKKLVATEAKKAMGDTPPLTNAIHLSLTFCYSIPKSWSAGKRYAASYGAVEKTSKPDIDNLCKGIMDALKGICWQDDSQVVTLNAYKQYDENPGVRVAIHQLREPDLAEWSDLHTAILKSFSYSHKKNHS